MQKVFPVLLLLALGSPAGAGEKKFEPDALAARVAPYLDEQTVIVLRVDLARVDADAYFAKLAGVWKGGAKELDGLKQTLGQALADFTKAGGKDLYLVFSLADLMSGPFVVVPLEAGADEKAIGKALSAALPDFHGQGEKIGSALVVAPKTVRDRLRDLKPAQRPEVTRAFAAAGDAVVHALLLPTDDMRRVVEEMLPTLPKEIGGGPGTALSRGLLWAAVAV